MAKKRIIKKGDILIRDTNYSTWIKYNVTRTKLVDGIFIVYGYRVKYDKKRKEWVTFGNERAFLPRDYRHFTKDDYHYL